MSSPSAEATARPLAFSASGAGCMPRMTAILSWLPWLAACTSSESSDLGGEDGGSEGENTAATESDAGDGVASADTDCDAYSDDRPDRLSEHVAVYDPDQAEMIVFGGTPTVPQNCSFGGDTEFLAETWIYSDNCNAWLEVDGTQPPAVTRPTAVWADGAMWLFGGRYREAAEGLYTLYNHLYRFDVADRSWSELEVSGELPSPRVNAAMAYDTQRQRIWMFGGNGSADGLFYEPLGDLWFFDLEDEQWLDRSGGSTSPPGRLFHSLLYDSGRDALVIFGGTDQTSLIGQLGTNQIWSASISDGQWQELGIGSDSVPDTRFWGSMVFDNQSDSYLMFGGHDDGDLGNRNDVWRFNPDDDEWSQVEGGDSFNAPARGFCDFPPEFAEIEPDMPERRSSHTLVWSEPNQQAILFGGKTDCGSTDDVWTLSDGQWEEQMPATEGEACLRWRDDPARCTDMCF